MRLISKETGLSPDYAFLIAKKLLGQKLIKKIANNIFILTANGRSLLERRRGSLERKIKPPALLTVSHNLGKDQTIEVTDAQSIQKSIKRLIFRPGKL